MKRTFLEWVNSSQRYGNTKLFEEARALGILIIHKGYSTDLFNMLGKYGVKKLHDLIDSKCHLQSIKNDFIIFCNDHNIK